MPGLVEQLQADALDHSVPVSTLLRKVKVCAVKLGLSDALAWVENELNGYTCTGSEMPDYRAGHGSPVGQDAFGRWLPVRIHDPDLATKVSKVYFCEPVSNYEEALSKKDERTFQLEVDPQCVSRIAPMFSEPIVAMRIELSRGHLNAVVEKVRDLVLDWALELSREGINGDGMSFSEKEKSRAEAAPIHIGTFHGSFNNGDATGAGALISQSYHVEGAEVSAITDLIAAVKEKVKDERQRDAIMSAASEIAQAKDKPSLMKAYERLLAAAADHMTIITPFLPALGAMLAGQ